MMAGSSSGFSLLAVFDGSSLLTIEHMATFDAAVQGPLYAAGVASLARLEMEAYTYMWATFQNPTGPLEDSLGHQMEGPYQGWMGTDSAYGRRRNWGFSGLTDSLGRYYPNDPGIEYMEHSIIYSSADIIAYYQTAVNQTVADLGGVP